MKKPLKNIRISNIADNLERKLKKDNLIDQVDDVTEKTSDTSISDSEKQLVEEKLKKLLNNLTKKDEIKLDKADADTTKVVTDKDKDTNNESVDLFFSIDENESIIPIKIEKDQIEFDLTEKIDVLNENTQIPTIISEKKTTAFDDLQVDVEEQEISINKEASPKKIRPKNRSKKKIKLIFSIFIITALLLTLLYVHTLKSGLNKQKIQAKEQEKEEIDFSKDAIFTDVEDDVSEEDLQVFKDFKDVPDSTTAKKSNTPPKK